MTDGPSPDGPTPKRADNIQFDCERCGAALSYRIGTTSLACPYCGSTQAIESVDESAEVVREFDLAQAILDHPRGGRLLDGGHEIRCEDCGAQAVLETQAGHCPYCDAPVVVEVEPSENLLVPDSVLPFSVDTERARAAFVSWTRRLWFAPNDLGKRARAEQLHGVFLPYFTYDSATVNRYRGQRGEYSWETEWYTDSDGERRSRQVRRTDWFPASGTVRVAFDDVLVYASESLPRKLVEKLEPWDLHRLEVFDAGYVSGFIAERYTIDLEPGFELAEKRMEPIIQKAVRQDIGGDTQRVSRLDIHHDKVTFKHCLLPLWLSSYRHRGKVYRFLVNARTGEVTGERPYSLTKILLVMLTVIVLIVVLQYAR